MAKSKDPNVAFEHLYFPASLLDRIDATCAAEGIKRSAFFVAAVEAHAAELDNLPGPVTQRHLGITVPKPISNKLRKVAENHGISISHMMRLVAERALSEREADAREG